MPVSAITPVIEYNGDDSTTAFATGFRFIEEEDLQVYLDGVLQTITTDYTLSGVNDFNGGTVTMVTPPATGEVLRIERRIDPFDRETDYVEGGPLPSITLDNDFDRVVMKIQELEDLGAMGTVAGSDAWDAEGEQIKNVADPTDPQDAATMAYVDLVGSQVKVSANDTTAGFLFEKLAASSTVSPLEVGDGGDEDVSLNIVTGSITNSLINASAAIALSKLATVTASRALVSTAGGVISASAVTATELGYVSGVTSAIQTQINSKANAAGYTASRVIISDGTGTLVVSPTIDTTELGYLNGVTSNIQTQIDSKANAAGYTASRVIISNGSGTLTTSGAIDTTELGYLDGVTSNIQTQINNLDTNKLENVVEDTTPQLGGNLDVNGNDIVSVSNGDIVITPNGTGRAIIDGLSYPDTDGSSGQAIVTNGAGDLSFSAIASTFLGLSDTPASYIGDGGDFVRVNLAENALEFVTGTAASGDIDHDATLNFVANEHIDHSSVSISSGVGLSGGGNITANRTLSLDIDGLTADSIASADTIPFNDDTDNVPNKITFGNFQTALDHDSLGGFVANEHINHTSVTLTAGAGLTGGGDISTNRTFNVIGLANKGIKVNADSVELDFTVGTATAVSGDFLLFSDTSDSGNIKKVNAVDLLGGGTSEFADSAFRIQDNVDATKEIAFEASGITTATTRTITMPDQNVDLTPGTGTFATAAEGDLAATALQDVVDDTTPQLGGNLDVDGNSIVSTSNGDITLAPNGTGDVVLGNFTLDGDQTVGAGQDNYVLTYDDGTGLISLEVASGGSAIENVVEDTTPQLGGNLDVNGNKIVSVSNGNIDIEPNGTGNILLGNFTIDADQTVGAGQDNYVLTYDDGTGLISLEVASGGASQLSELSDVNTSTPTDKNVLVADGVDWESRALVEADISDLGTYLENVVEDTTPQLGANLDTNGFNIQFDSSTGIYDDQNNEMLVFSRETGSANYMEIRNRQAGNPPSIFVKGSDTDVDMQFITKGTGVMQVVAGSGNYEDNISADDDIPNKKYVDDEITAAGGLSDVVDDTTPQLGGTLDINGQDITDGSNFEWDSSAGQLAIQTTSHSLSSDGGTSGVHFKVGTVDLSNFFCAEFTSITNTGSLAPIFAFTRARDSSGSPALVSSGDRLSNIVAYGYDGDEFLSATRIYSRAVGTPAADDMPAELRFSTRAAGAGSISDRFVIESNGTLASLNTTYETLVTADDDIPNKKYVDDAIDSGASVGKHTLWIPSGAMSPTVSNPCSDITKVELTSGRPDLNVLDFDQGSDEHAQFSVAFPKSWNLGTITYQVFWTSTATDTDGVAWALQGVAVSDSDAVDSAYGTAIVVVDNAQSTADDLYVSAESSALTIGGTPADNDLCYFRVFRDVSNGSDTMGEDARLIGVKLFFTTDAATDD